MKKQILTEEFYGHTLEVTIDSIYPDTNFIIEFIPDKIKEWVLMALENNVKSGNFRENNTVQWYGAEIGDYRFNGSWHILPEIDTELLYDIIMWNYNHYSDESLSEELFIKHFGVSFGKHFYDKWKYSHKRELLLMIAYFGKEQNHVRTFIKMLLEQVEKYKQKRK